MRKGLILILLLFLLLFPLRLSYSATIVTPGETGSIQFPIENDSLSTGSAENMEILVDAPSYFIVHNTSILGPVSIPSGNIQTFTIDYEIENNAPAGSFDVVFKTTSTIDNIYPLDDTLHPLWQENCFYPVPVDNSTISGTCQPRQGITHASC